MPCCRCFVTGWIGFCGNSPSFDAAAIAGGKVFAPSVPDAVWRQQRLVLEHLSEEPLGGGDVTVRRQQKVDGISTLVDGPVQLAPLAAYLDGRPRRRGWSRSEACETAAGASRSAEHTPTPIDSKCYDRPQIRVRETSPQYSDSSAASADTRKRPGEASKWRPLKSSMEIVHEAALQLLDDGLQDHRRPPQNRNRNITPIPQDIVNPRALR